MKTILVVATVQYKVKDSEPITISFANDGEFTTNSLTELKLPQNREQFEAAVAIAEGEANGQLIDIDNIIKYI